MTKSTTTTGKLTALMVAATVAGACGGSMADAPASNMAVWSVDPEPAITIGGSDGREEYLLYRVVGASRLSDGRIVVANSGTSELRFYTPEGAYEGAAGGEGDGPGEMRFMVQLVPLPGDSLLVFSFRPGFTWFSPTGDYVRSVGFDMRSSQVECRIGESMRLALPDASLVTVFEDNFSPSNCPPEPASPWRQTGLITRETPDRAQFDSLAIMPATERNSPNYRVFGKSLVLGLATDRIYAADTGADVILSLGLEGDTLAELPTPFEARPVPASARTVEVREFTRPDGTVQVGNAYLYPETYPRIARLLVSRSGGLWVMAYPTIEEPISSYQLALPFVARADPDGARWRVLSPEGELVAEVRTPPGFFPLEIGEDYILGVSKDALDVETVSLHALQR